MGKQRKTGDTKGQGSGISIASDNFMYLYTVPVGLLPGQQIATFFLASWAQRMLLNYGFLGLIFTDSTSYILVAYLHVYGFRLFISNYSIEISCEIVA